MGSFTCKSKVIPASDADDHDVYYPSGREDLSTFLSRCSQHLATLPPPIERKWKRRSRTSSEGDAVMGEKVRVLQWNVLSQGG